MVVYQAGVYTAEASADACWQLACILHHGRQNVVQDCDAAQLTGAAADLYILCLFWGANGCGLHSVVTVNGQTHASAIGRGLEDRGRPP